MINTTITVVVDYLVDAATPPAAVVMRASDYYELAAERVFMGNPVGDVGAIPERLPFEGDPLIVVVPDELWAGGPLAVGTAREELLLRGKKPQ